MAVANYTESEAYLNKNLTIEETKKCYLSWDTTKQLAQCGFCDKFFKLSGNTTNARKHLIKKHCEVVTEFVASKKNLEEFLVELKSKQTPKPAENSSGDIQNKKKTAKRSHGGETQV
jgi:hypothetical protein